NGIARDIGGNGAWLQWRGQHDLSPERLAERHDHAIQRLAAVGEPHARLEHFVYWYRIRQPRVARVAKGAVELRPRYTRQPVRLRARGCARARGGSYARAPDPVPVRERLPLLFLGNGLQHLPHPPRSCAAREGSRGGAVANSR